MPMRILVLGAGAVGGYFGGRMLEAGRDVTFLVRPKRAAQIRAHGLRIRSPLGDATLDAPCITEVRQPFDLTILTCKAYDLNSALDAVAPAGGTILPLLNGMRHLDVLDARFGPDRVLGGLCAIAATIAEDGAIAHLNRTHDIRFGERTGERSARTAAIAEEMAPARMNSHWSETILQDMWEKWVMLASLAGITCLMRAGIGAIVSSPAGRQLVLQLLDECASAASAHGFTPRTPFLDRTRALLTDPASSFTASMLRDIERGGRTEADHVIGDLIARAEAKAIAVPVLRTAYCHLKAYELRRGN